MSDERANIKEEETKAAEGAVTEELERLWSLTVVFDPETGQLAFQGNKNLDKNWKIDLLLAMANKHVQAGVVVGSVTAALRSIQQTAEKKKSSLWKP